MDEWAFTVIGTKEYVAAVKPADATNSVTPTMVMGVRKKRKPDIPSEAATETEKLAEPAQIPGEGTVRKKAKTEPTPITDASAANGVNTLTAGLVRKKPKV
jgi:regulator of Ty1 transposition protein 109